MLHTLEDQYSAHVLHVAPCMSAVCLPSMFPALTVTHLVLMVVRRGCLLGRLLGRSARSVARGAGAHNGKLFLVGVVAEAHAQVRHIGLLDVIAVGAAHPVVAVHPVHLHLQHIGTRL